MTVPMETVRMAKSRPRIRKNRIYQTTLPYNKLFLLTSYSHLIFPNLFHKKITRKPPQPWFNLYIRHDKKQLLKQQLPTDDVDQAFNKLLSMRYTHIKLLLNIFCFFSLGLLHLIITILTTSETKDFICIVTRCWNQFQSVQGHLSRNSSIFWDRGV